MAPSPFPECRFRESIHQCTEMVSYRCERIVFSGRSRYQQIDIVDTQAHGRMLFLDGVAQSAEYDEFIYHEVLVHPALLSHPHPRSVLVIGGAEGATLREVLRHRRVETVTMVDIDAELVELCRTHLPQWHQGSYDDPRAHVVFDDGRRYLSGSRETFDCIILDLSDPDPGSPAERLFTLEFYRLVLNRLKPGGVLSLQGEDISPQNIRLHASMMSTLREVFPQVVAYSYTLPSFHRPDADFLATTDRGWSIEAIAQRLEASELAFRYLSPSLVRGMFALPAYATRAYEIHRKILTDVNMKNL